MDLVDDVVLVAADRLRAYAVASGAQLWEADFRGSRLASTPDGAGVIVASEQGLAALRLDGAVRWQQPYPDAVRDAAADQITVEGSFAYVTFRPRGERREPLDVDVIAVAL
jgi:hypothetical protein